MPAAEFPNPPRQLKTPRRIDLYARDFSDGPFVVHEPDVVVRIMQDVEFNFPDPPSRESPFHLGFFCGIAIGASRVTIDLNGKTLRMHPNYRARQRFFALLSCDITPFPVGKAKFTTEPKSPSDITIRNGTLGLTSHFCIHANTLTEGRVLISDVKMEDFEVGAVSLSGGVSDTLIRRCAIGSAVPPTTSSDVNMLRDLAKVVRENGATADADALMSLAAQHTRVLTSSDAIVRAIVILPEFNVNTVPETFSKRIRRVAVVDCTFDDLRADPVEVVGITLVKGSDEALKDVRGNLIAYDDAKAGAKLSRIQAAYTPELPRAARDKLMHGPSTSFYPVHGLDRRAHALQKKSSLFIRIDGCDDVTLRNLKGSKVMSWGSEAAAVGIMLNVCERITVAHVRIQSVQVHDVCSDALSNDRPQSGILLRRCKHVNMNDFTYESADSCASSFRMTDNVVLTKCTMRAPSTFLQCKHIAME